MASGDIVASLGSAQAPSQNAATAGNFVMSASGNRENLRVISYADGSTTHWDFHGLLDNYGGGGVNVQLPWFGGATGDVQFRAAFRRMPTGHDLTANHTYGGNTGVSTAAAIATLVLLNIALADGAQMDSLSNGDRFILRVSREGAEAADTLAEMADLIWPSVVIREQ